MTDSQNNPQPTDVDDLARGLDGSNAQRAEAIAVFVDGRIAVAITGVNERLEELATEHRQTVKTAADLPPAQRDEVKEEVNEAGREVRAAKAEASDLSDRQNAGEQVTKAEVRQAQEHADQASAKVEQVKTSVDERADKQRGDEDGPSSKKGTGDFITRTEFHQELDQVCARQDELVVVSATAFASATANDNPDARRRVLLAAAGAALIAFLIYLLVLIGPEEWDWNWGIALPAIVGAVTGLIVWALTRQDGPSATSVASANAIVERWNQRDNSEDDHQQDGEGDDSVVPGMTSGRGANASAGASAHS